ncbi:hypothetical protein L7F22_062991 [Adiantum nelumboides]|nr:hypothetical protein [Adiantum nelumboides]
MRTLDPKEMGISRSSADIGQDTTGYGRHLLELGSRHHLVIYNEMHQWPDSIGLTCFPHGGGGSNVDYILGPLSATHLLQSFSIGRCPLGADHTFLSFTLLAFVSLDIPPPTHTHTTIHFTRELSHVYTDHLHSHLLTLDSHAPLDTLTTQLTHILHDSALHTHSTHTYPPREGSMPQNGWYDDDCRELRRGLRTAETLGEITHRQAQRRMQSLIRRKKREWEERQYWELYHLLMSRDSEEAWRRIRERGRPPIHKC